MMLRNDLRVAIRQAGRQKGLVALHVGGLALAMACCIVLVLFVQSELRYDRYHTHADRIYRLFLETDAPGGVRHMGNMPGGMAAAIVAGRPEVERAVRIGGVAQGQNLLSNGRTRAYEEGLFFADADVFEVFSLPLAEGDPATALRAPFSIVLGAELARKYFGDGPAVGETLETAEGQIYQVTGVLKPVPAVSHWRPRALIAFETLRPLGRSGLDALNDYFAYRTYLLLRPGVDAGPLEAQLPALLPAAGEQPARFRLQPLPALYLHSLAEAEKQGSMVVLYVFSGTALLILLIACANYMNLSVARALQRAREVGVRKMAGARWGQLVRQFLVESTVLALAAGAAGLALAVAALPFFNRLAGREVALPATDVAWLGPGVLALALLVGVGSGLYPALTLAAVRPAAVLKGQSGRSARGRLQAGLVTFQFVITIVLIVSTVTMYRQVRFAQDTRLGAETNQVLVVPVDRNSPVGDRYDAFREALLRHPAIEQVAAGTGVPTRLRWQTRLQRLEGVEASVLERQYVSPVGIDAAYLETLGLRLVDGHFWHGRISGGAADTVDVPFVVNQAFASAFGLTAPVGTALQLKNARGRIVGVVEDAHFGSVREAISPLLFRPLEGRADFMVVQFAAREAVAVQRAVADAWQGLDPARPVEAFFLDEAFARLYAAEQRLADLFALFAGMAILIACLGLFGLAAQTAARRRKEIGVRKVLGASLGHVLIALAGPFLRYVGVAFVLACPLAAFGLHRWLDGFVYRVGLTPASFLLAGALAAAVALLTLLPRVLHAARANPVESLRYE